MRVGERDGEGGDRGGDDGEGIRGHVREQER